LIRVSLQKNSCFLVLVLLPLFAHAQSKPLDFFQDLSYLLTPRILEDGNITDTGFGMMYSGPIGGEIRFRYTQIARNEEISDTDDSLNAVNEKVYEVFVLPFQYRFIQKPNLKLMGGAGLYYEYDKLNEKGFFIMNFLEDLGLERVNAYKNEFTMHLVGPLLDGSVHYNTEWFNIGFSAGIVPVFYVDSTQKLKMDPLIHPGTADLSENTGGSPYFYFTLDSIMFKYVNVTFSYNYAKLTKKIITPQLEGYQNNEGQLIITDRSWIYPEQSAVTQSVMIEISALLPVGNGISFQIGYGYIHNFISLDSSPVIQEGKHCLILSNKKISF